jgi:hypothetical protein
LISALLTLSAFRSSNSIFSSVLMAMVEAYVFQSSLLIFVTCKNRDGHIMLLPDLVVTAGSTASTSHPSFSSSASRLAAISSRERISSGFLGGVF